MPTYSIASVLHMSDDTGDLNGDPIEALRSVAASGYDEVELIAEGVGWEDGPPDSAPFREALESTGLYPHTIHAPFKSINLASMDEGERKDSVAQVAAAMRFHAEVGGRTIIVHPSGSPTSPDEPLYTKENVGATTEMAHRSVSELVRVGEETGVRMALENLVAKVGFDARPLETMQELRSFMADLPAEYVGICHDIGHTRLRKLDVANETRIASDRLYALHHPGRFLGRGRSPATRSRGHRLRLVRAGAGGHWVQRCVDDGSARDESSGNDRGRCHRVGGYSGQVDGRGDSERQVAFEPVTFGAGL